MRLEPKHDGMEVFAVLDRRDGHYVPLYSRSCGHEFFYPSADNARWAQVDDLFKDKTKYRVDRFKVTLTLIEEGADEERPEE